MDEVEQAVEAGRRRVAGRPRSREAKRAAPRQRAPVEAAWTTPVTTSSATRAIRSSGSSRCSARASTSCARCSTRRPSRWRGDALRLGEGSRQRLNALFYELGLITRDDWDELDLRVAQLEHRLRLLEDAPAAARTSR